MVGQAKKGFQGIVKKVAIFAVITVAISLDYLLAVAAQQLNMSPPKMALFGLLVVAWFLLNEMLSIIENAGRMGVPIPEWLGKYIAVLKTRIDDQGGGAAPSLFSPILAGQGGTDVGEWQQPDSTNPYNTGDRCYYQGVLYESTIDGNVWNPADYPAGWRVVA